MQSYVNKSDDYFAHARKEISPLLPLHCGRVLEVGCGSGSTLGWLRSENRTAYTVGVEISEAAAQVARSNADEVFCFDFESAESPLGDQTFELILCLDVLEHMFDPWRAIDRLVSKHLAPGGTLVASLPNVRHYSLVLPLLFGGRWEYQEAGLLDRTHLRFFTKNTAISLLSHPQMHFGRCMALGFEWPSLKATFNLLTAGLFKEFLTYQYFLSAKKIE
jgi:2-polyprenyl-3-methyl-5-hydroxy-6-metoxy-1,4-benzoquinol methylase